MRYKDFCPTKNYLEFLCIKLLFALALYIVVSVITALLLQFLFY